MCASHFIARRFSGAPTRVSGSSLSAAGASLADAHHALLKGRSPGLTPAIPRLKTSTGGGRKTSLPRLDTLSELGGGGDPEQDPLTSRSSGPGGSTAGNSSGGVDSSGPTVHWIDTLSDCQQARSSSAPFLRPS